jgi:hypothetical protein
MPSQKIYNINRHIKVIKQSEKVSITFRGNVNSISVIMPFMSIFMAGNILYNEYIGYLKLSSGLTNGIYIVILISLILISTESTLIYSIHIDKENLSIVTSRIGVKVRKEIPIKKINSIRRIEVSDNYTSGTPFYRPRLCICYSTSEEILPLMLSENNIDEIIRLLREYINY